MPTNTTRQPKPRPKDEELHKAFKVVDDWFLHFYQLLYFNTPRLTEPGLGHPFHLQFSAIYRNCIEVQCNPWNGRRKEFDFLITMNKSDEEVLSNCNAIIKAISENKASLNQTACCPLAEPINCVCTYAFKCQVHGEKHIGTHD